MAGSKAELKKISATETLADVKRVAAVPQLPHRAFDANKGDCGKITVIGGSRGMAGAPCLAARAAYRAGAGLVRVAVPMSIWDVVAGKLDECLTYGLPETDAGTLARKGLRPYGNDSEWADVMVLGPGLSQHSETVDEVRAFVTRVKQTLVLDADGLNAFTGQLALLRHPSRQTVLTPHPGEMARLLKLTSAQIQADRPRAVFECARMTGCVVALKGAITLVCDGERMYQNTTGNPGMATGGTGDVLTGVIAGLIGQKMKPFEAACLGVYLHGLAGDISASRVGVHSLMAGDLLSDLPKAIMMHGQKKAKTMRL
jgi:hydroxyethylthiazole kinase-like uncharacterized protein yjeF